MKIWKIFKWVLLGFGILAVGFFILFLAMALFGPGPKFNDVDVNNPPKFIKADFLDLDKVTSITKYRSGWGHSYAGNGETCRSMKHEFAWKNQGSNNVMKQKMEELQKAGVVVTENDVVKIKQEMAKNRDESLAVPFYSPVDGRVGWIGESSKVGNSIEISVNDYPGWTVRMFHVWIDPSIHFQSSLKAGQVVGKSYTDIGWGDIAIHYNYIGGQRLVSYFQVMPDNLFAKYQARGVKSRDDLIISKAYRDDHQLQCLNNRPETPDYAQKYADTPEGYKENIFDLN